MVLRAVDGSGPKKAGDRCGASRYAHTGRSGYSSRMSTQTTITRVELSDWQTEQLRLTLFPPEPPHKLPGWAELTGEQPEIRQSFPGRGAALEAGTFDEGWLTVDSTRERVDCRLVFRLDDAEEPRPLPSIGPFDRRLRAFQRVTKRWLRTVGRLDRLAFGAIALLPAESHEDGYRKLGKLLASVKIDLARSRDLLYRINRRRLSTSGIGRLEINRLTSWSVVRATGAAVRLSGDDVRFVPLEEASYACRLELDINTVAEFTKGLGKAKIPKLWDELIELGVEIAEKGDVP